jgi:lysophospholipase L1-like esterase
MKKTAVILIAFLFSLPLTAQMKWWNPEENAFPVVGGQAWHAQTEEYYDRLPLRAKKEVREVVWHLSKASAGLVIRFRSNAGRIVVRYGVSGGIAFSHMPATGVSGLDLYARDSQGRWMWVRGNRSFGDTVRYDFSGIRPNDEYHKMGREYRLYLPLYNQVKWMEIGVADTALFEPWPLRREKPIVIYGTSIAQGACAPRPGLAWSSLLERRLDRPVINLGFSGNGMLEKELITLLTEIDAKLYILDCLPNMIAPRFTDEEVRQNILAAVEELQAQRPEVPILLVEHDGYTDGTVQPGREKTYQDINAVMEKTFAEMKAAGKKNIWLLTKEELGQNIESQTDGTHPNAYGMMLYADAYEKKIRMILKTPAGETPATIPVTQDREPHNYLWQQRHQRLLKENAENPPRIVMLGNSITHFWGGVPGCKFRRGPDSWDRYLAPKGVKNMGFGWDRVENVLWRINHDELDGYKTKQVVMLIGVNNFFRDDDEEILRGLSLLVQTVRQHQPHAEILVLGILPWKDREERIRNLNLKIARLAGDLNVRYGDIGKRLAREDGTIDPEAFTEDGLHPNATGYERMGKALAPLLK